VQLEKPQDSAKSSKGWAPPKRALVASKAAFTKWEEDMLARKRVERKHNNRALKVCHTCKKTFNDASNFRRHLKTHSGDKVHKCNQCDYAAIELGDLRRHMKIHSGEKPTNALNTTMQLFRHAS